MTRLSKALTLNCLVILGIITTVQCGVSSKMDFANEEDSIAVYTTNSSKPDDEDVEVEHTIVVSTKLKNNNRRGGIHGPNEDGVLTYNIGAQGLTGNKPDSGEVPVVMGYKAADSTQIRTPDTRTRNKVYPESVFINRNIRDEYDVVFPEIALNAGQWKPSTYFNNINWLNAEPNRGNYNFIRRADDQPLYQNPGKIHRKITGDGQREFYCRKCRELSQGREGCVQRRSNSNSWLYQTTTSTPKVKIDGKLAKLN